MKLQKNVLLFVLSIITLSFNLNAKDKKQPKPENYNEYYQKSFVGIGNLKYFQQAYPDIIFQRKYIKEIDDWLITITVPKTPGKQDPEGKKFEFYWSNGRMLPEEELKNKEKYWSLLTYYAKTIRNPETYSKEEIDAINYYTSEESREESKGSPMFFFDAVYDTKTRGSTEKHIKTIKFMNKSTNVHERIVTPMKNVEAKIKAAAETDPEIMAFIKSIKTYDSYAWREIRGTGRRSFHGLGLATDIMPKYLAGKQIFWSWAKDKYPKTWMKVPLERRWIPPQKIIDIFESEGFVWGGKWVIYDNMHFEYHPELILYNSQENLFPWNVH